MFFVFESLKGFFILILATLGLCTIGFALPFLIFIGFFALLALFSPYFLLQSIHFGDFKSRFNNRLAEQKKMSKDKDVHIKNRLISKTDLSYLFIPNFVVLRSKLSGSNFRGSDLRRSKIEFSNLKETDFRDTNLSKSQLFCVRASRSNFIDSDLNRATVLKSIVSNSVFVDMNMSYLEFFASILSWSRFESCLGVGTHFLNSRLVSTDFRKCNLKKSSFSKTRLNGSFFEKCDLRKVDFSEADLRGVVIKKCNVKGVQWENAIFSSKSILPFGRKKAIRLGMKQAA